jgi:hypothetical protein
VTQEDQRLDPQEEQDTRESDAVAPAQVSFEPEQVEAVGDPAAASVDADAGAVEPAFVAEPAAAEEPAYADQSPIAADSRGAEQAESPPIGAIVGAFVGAFVAAKLLGRLGGGDD